MMRPVKDSPDLARSRKYTAACLLGAQVPFTCTVSTESKSASLMFQIAESRTMPALLTRMSSLP